MNILIIGGTRFIGKHLVRQLTENGHNVTIATRGITADDFAGSVSRIIFDRSSEESIAKHLAAQTYDVVYDSLAYCSNDVRILLKHIKCGKYIMISSASVYKLKMDTKEEDFRPQDKKLIWCRREDFPYDESKQQAECALAWEYFDVPCVSVRFPYAAGEDDYTKRLYFYVEQITRQQPVYINNYNDPMAFVRSDEAGKLLAFLADKDYCGAINGASEGTITIKEIADYVSAKTQKPLILSEDGAEAPYNGTGSYSINTDRAKSLGFEFSPLGSWIYGLVDRYIDTAAKQ